MGTTQYNTNRLKLKKEKNIWNDFLILVLFVMLSNEIIIHVFHCIFMRKQSSWLHDVAYFLMEIIVVISGQIQGNYV